MKRRTSFTTISEKEYALDLLKQREHAKRRIVDLEAVGNFKEAEYWGHDLRKLEKIIAENGYNA